jgi:hypothetical protein
MMDPGSKRIQVWYSSCFSSLPLRPPTALSRRRLSRRILWLHFGIEYNFRFCPHRSIFSLFCQAKSVIFGRNRVSNTFGYLPDAVITCRKGAQYFHRQVERAAPRRTALSTTITAPRRYAAAFCSAFSSSFSFSFVPRTPPMT